MFWLLSACSRHTPELPPEEAQPEEAPTIAQSEAFYASQPEMMRPFPRTAVPEGLPNLSASTCGGCHQEIYAEWKISTHARAWMDDAQFQAELHKSIQPDSDVGWLCINCHTPLVNQLPVVVAGLRDGALDQPLYVDNPSYDPMLQDDAITCAACHVRDGVVYGPFGDTNAPHPVAKGDSLLTAEVCTRCHEASAVFPEVNLGCFFHTGSELAESALPEQGYRCQSCHMPEVTRPLVPGGPERATRRHWFGGSLIAKHPDYVDELAAIASHYPDGMTFSWSALPAALPAPVTVTYTNANAGHMLPTGDPERYILIHLEAVGPDGQVIASADERIGAVYQWYPEIKKLSDDRLRPGESRDLVLDIPAAAGPVTLTLTASKWRLTEENIAFHNLEGQVVAGRTFHTAQHIIQ